MNHKVDPSVFSHLEEKIEKNSVEYYPTVNGFLPFSGTKTVIASTQDQLAHIVAMAFLENCGPRPSQSTRKNQELTLEEKQKLLRSALQTQRVYGEEVPKSVTQSLDRLLQWVTENHRYLTPFQTPQGPTVRIGYKFQLREIEIAKIGRLHLCLTHQGRLVRSILVLNRSLSEKNIDRALKSIGLAKREIIILRGSTRPKKEIQIDKQNGTTHVTVSSSVWRKKPLTVISQLQALSSYPLPTSEQLRGRVLSVLSNHLPADRLITKNQLGQLNLPPTTRRSNLVLKELTGKDDLFIAYGTSDLFNSAELIQVMVTAATLSRYFPSVRALFFTYPQAHWVGSYLERILIPSLKLLGMTVRGNHVPPSLYQARYVDVCAQEVFAALGYQPPRQLRKYLSLPLPQFYQRTAGLLVDFFTRTAGLTPVPLNILELEELFEACGFFDLKMKDLTETIRTLRGDISIAQRTHGNQTVFITTEAVTRSEADLSLRDYLALTGSWLSGSLIHLALSYLGTLGPFIFNLKDSRLGEVAKLAITNPPHRPPNQIICLCSRVTRLYPSPGSNGGNNIDACVLYDILTRMKRPMREQLMSFIAASLRPPLSEKESGEIYHFYLQPAGRRFAIGPRQFIWRLDRFLENHSALTFPPTT